MTERNSAESNYYEIHNMYPNLGVSLSGQQQFLKIATATKDCFAAEIKERELMSKRLSKYIASSESFDKSLIVLSVMLSVATFLLYHSQLSLEHL